MPYVRNGQFERPTVSAGNGFSTFVAGQSFDGWKVLQGSVDIVGASFWEPGDGAQSLDLNGTTRGIVRTKFETQIGATYELKFLAAGSASPLVTDSDLSVFVGKRASGRNDFLLPGSPSNGDMDWQEKTITFTATREKTKFFFSGDGDSGANGPALDAVRVELVTPAPASVATDWSL